VENVEDEGEGEGEGEEEGQWLAVGTGKAGGELRELLSTVLYFCSSSLDSGECRRRRRRRKGRERGRVVAGGGNDEGWW
jgi:hypothetical protein